MRQVRSQPAEVLLVEDNENDVELTLRAFQKERLQVNLQHVWNGEECMSYLRREGDYADKPPPDLILLDLNLPVMDGREVLAEIVNDEKLRRLPVVILTTSAAEADLLRMYELRCSAYIVKPVDFDRFREVIRSLGDFWFSVAMLPPKP